MAIPVSGSLSIKGTAGTCRSICQAVVDGGGGASGSLSTLSVNAGKSAPHCIREFYGYDPNPTTTCICFCTIASNPGPSTSCCNSCLKRTPTASVGNCFNANFCLYINVVPDSEFGGTAMGCVRLICNAITVFSCQIACTTNQSWVCAYSRNVDYNDTFCMITCASDCGFLGGFASARICLCSITTISGSYARCTPNCQLTTAGVLPH